MQDQFSRTRLLVGKLAIDTLNNSKVAVFGVGGVGGYVVEILARSGVGQLDIFDNDRVCITNINRQIIALVNTIGKFKVDIAEERIHNINPYCIVNTHKMFYLPSNANDIDLSVYDYVVDCIDTVSAKLELIRRCHKLNTPIISCMGAANKMDPTAFKICDISKTKMDPLAKVIRKKLRKEGIYKLKVVYSEEEPLKKIKDCDNSKCLNESASQNTEHQDIPASNAFVPAAEGIIAGGEVIKDIIYKAHTMRIIPENAKTNSDAIKAEKTQSGNV